MIGLSRLYFKHNQPPVFSQRTKRRRIYRLMLTTFFNILLLTIIIFGSYYLLTSGFFEKVRNQYQIKIANPPNSMTETKKEERLSTNQITAVIAPMTNLAEKEKANFWQKLARETNVRKIVLLAAAGSDLTNVTQELTGNFRDAAVTSVAIKADSQREELEKTVRDLSSDCPKDCLFIGLTNFSRDLPPVLTSLHNEASFKALAKFDFEAILKDIEVDSPPVLFLTSKIAATQNSKYLHLENPSDPKLAYYTKDKDQATKLESSTTFIFAGDAMFDRLIHSRFKDNLKDVFSEFGDRIFKGIDLAILNLEGPISDQPIEDDINPENLTFNFPPQTSQILQYLNIDVVSLANNHTLNAGIKGFEITKSSLTQVDIVSFGHQKELGEFSIYRSTKGDLPISVIAVNTLEGSHQLALREKIEQEKKANRFIIIFPHWGVEYEEINSKKQEGLASDWFDWGADLIIGSHPHVVQNFSRINGKIVVYSLGNFVFDQTFSSQTQQGLIIAGRITQNELTLAPLPIQSAQLKPRLVKEEAKKKIIQSLVDDLKLEVGEKYDEQKGTITIKRIKTSD